MGKCLTRRNAFLETQKSAGPLQIVHTTGRGKGLKEDAPGTNLPEAGKCWLWKELGLGNRPPSCLGRILMAGPGGGETEELHNAFGLVASMQSVYKGFGGKARVCFAWAFLGSKSAGVKAVKKILNCFS